MHKHFSNLFGTCISYLSSLRVTIAEIMIVDDYMSGFQNVALQL